MLRSQQGLPMPDAVLDAEAALVEPTTASDAIVCVTRFSKSPYSGRRWTTGSRTCATSSTPTGTGTTSCRGSSLIWHQTIHCPSPIPRRTRSKRRKRISSISGLLAEADHRSLTSLAQALVALPGYRARAEAFLRTLVAPPLPEEQVYEWCPSDLTGRRFKTEGEVDEVLGAIGEELKTRIRKGFTVVVK